MSVVFEPVTHVHRSTAAYGTANGHKLMRPPAAALRVRVS